MKAPDLETIAAKVAIGDMMADYAAAIDWQDFGAMERLFWPDARFDYGLFQGGFEEFRDWVTALETGYDRRFHMFGLPVIRVETGKARIDATSVLLCRKGDTDEYFWGRYLFTAEARDGASGVEWRLSSLTYVANLLQQVAATTGDAEIPLHWATGLTADHPLSQRG